VRLVLRFHFASAVPTSDQNCLTTGKEVNYELFSAGDLSRAEFRIAEVCVCLMN